MCRQSGSLIVERRQTVRHYRRTALAAVLVVFVAAFRDAGRADAESGSAGAPKVLADFEQADAVQIRPQQATAEVVSWDGSKALQIETEGAANWPGVFLMPGAGKWDLSAYEQVVMDVINPQEVAVRVLLSVNNPGADGQKGCNVASVEVPPRGKARLDLPFGHWHGEPDRPIDQANVVSVQVLLDRPGRGHRFLVDNIRAEVLDRSRKEAVFADPFYRQLKPAFGRGVNLGNALEAPREGEWGVVLKEEYFDLIRDAGFDSVRIPVRWSAHARKESPYAIDPTFFERVDWAIEQALKRRLLVVVNVHHYEEIFRDPDGHEERFLALWEQIAKRYRNSPPAVAFELLNEPHANLNAHRWNRMLVKALAVVRRSNPTRQVVIGPAGWNSIDELPQLHLPQEDRNLIVTFHYYSPFQFTHQGASWVGGDANRWLGTRWTGTAAERAGVERDLDKAITWAVEHRRPIYMGEFGVYSRADMDSRARWTRFVAEQALVRKIGFAYWEFCSGFGVYDADRNEWRKPLKDALLSDGGR